MAQYDATNPEARKYYWDLIDKGLFKLDWMHGWMDRLSQRRKGWKRIFSLATKLAAGSGDRFVNIFL